MARTKKAEAEVKEKKAKTETKVKAKESKTKAEVKETKTEEKVSEVKTVKATAKTIRHPARKVRYVLDLIRGKDVAEALGILKFTPNHAAEDVSKVVKSATANAKNNFKLDESKLYVKECFANEGFTLKRYMPRAKGSAGSINKRTSHITVVVAER